MMMKLSFLLALIVGVVAAAAATTQQTEDTTASAGSDILLESFDDPGHHWYQMNDPVMGGKSTGTFEIDADNGLGVFDGQVVDVPALKAPGFIKVQSTDLKWQPYPDISKCNAFLVQLRSSVLYDGYRMGFGLTHPPDGKTFAWGYKADLTVPLSTEFVRIRLPFTDFTDLWDDATGDAITTCHQDPQYCPTETVLQNIRTISFWAEGVAGHAHLEIQSISATECN